MTVNEDLTAYSTTAASNTPPGTETVGPDLDDHLRDIKKNVRIASESSQGATTPGVFRGRWYYSTSASPTHTMMICDGASFIPTHEIDASANTSVPIIGAAAMGAVMQGLNQDSTASAFASLLDTGSATAIDALPAVSGENLIATREVFSFKASNETTEIVSATTTAVVVYMPFKMNVNEVRINCTEAPSATAVFDLNIAGSTMFSTNPRIDGGTFSSRSASTTSVLLTTIVQDEDRLGAAFDSAGGGGLKGVQFTLIGTRST